MDARRRRLVLIGGGTGVVVVVVAVAAVVLMRGEDYPELEEGTPELHRAQEYRFDLRVRPWRGADAVAARVGELIRDSAREVEAVGSAEHAEQLAEIVRMRVELLLEPDEARWVEHVSRFGEPPALDDPEQRESWQHAARAFERSRIATEGVRVREIDPDENPFASMSPGTMIRRPGGAPIGTYPSPDPADPTTVVVEALVPMMFRDGEDRMFPTTVGIRYFRTAGDETWRPYEMFKYQGTAGLYNGMAGRNYLF